MHKILLVEDDKLIRDELETLLVNAGCAPVGHQFARAERFGQSPPKKEVLAVSPSREAGKRRYSGFNLLSEETVLILETIASGDFILNGFDNKSLRRRVCKNSEDKNLSFLCDF